MNWQFITSWSVSCTFVWGGVPHVAGCPASFPSCSQLHGFTVGTAVLLRTPLMKQSGVKCSRQTDVLEDEGPNQSVRRIWTNFTQAAKRAESVELSGKLWSDPFLDKHPPITHFRPIFNYGFLFYRQRQQRISTLARYQAFHTKRDGPKFMFVRRSTERLQIVQKINLS